MMSKAAWFGSFALAIVLAACQGDGASAGASQPGETPDTHQAGDAGQAPDAADGLQAGDAALADSSPDAPDTSDAAPDAAADGTAPDSSDGDLADAAAISDADEATDGTAGTDGGTDGGTDAQGAGPDAADAAPAADSNGAADAGQTLCPSTAAWCDGPLAHACVAGQVESAQDCGALGQVCTNGACCLPDCTGKQCGDDSCGGTCGHCPAGILCKDSVCVSATSCVGKCGGQGAGCWCDAGCENWGDCCADFCDACAESLANACCEPDCVGKDCGDDGCGGYCGACGAGSICSTAGTCVACTPSCDAATCGDDGCGGTCGECGPGEACTQSAQCEPCTPICQGTPCEADGCGGFCDCPVDCANLPKGPFPAVVVPGAIASEGIAFDAEGNLVGSNTKAIFKSKYAQAAQLFVTSIKQRAAMAYLPGGDLMVNDNNTGTVWRVTPDGQQKAVVTGLTYPNGMCVDLEGFVYVTEETNSLVLRIDPDGLNSYEVLSNGTILHPNGITFDPTYKRLYVAGWQGDGFVWVIDRGQDGSFQAPKKWSKKLGLGLDGLEVDICGNVYVNDYSNGGMVRLPPDGQSLEQLVDEIFWIPNMQWGQGVGGWSPTRIYVPNGDTFQVHEIDVGVPGKKLAYP